MTPFGPALSASSRGWALALSGVAITGVLVAGSGADAPASVETVAGTSSTLPAAAASTRLAPASLSIPAIAVTAPVDALGFDESAKNVKAASDPDRTSWFRNGAVPGKAGSAVILGDVDSLTGPAVFHRLAELRAGDKVSITMTDRSVVKYRVTKVAAYSNTTFPAQRLYRATGPSTLSLVTDGGLYDAVEGYQQKVVVSTELVGTRAG